MKMIRHFKIYPLVLSLALLCGCMRGESGTDPGETAVVNVGLDITLSRLSAPSGAARTEGNGGITITYATAEATAITRGPIAEDPGYRVADLTVLQSGSRGTLLTLQYLDDIQLPTPEVSGDKLVYRPEVSLFESPQSTIYIVANTGDPGIFAGVKDIDTFRKAVISLPDEPSLLSGGMVPMTGSFTGPVNKDGEITVGLERLLAKLEAVINIALANSSKELELHTAQLVSVPVTARWFDSFKNVTVLPFGDGGYPDITDTGVQAFFTDYPEKNIPSSGELVFYLPENIRGTGSNMMGGEKLKFARNDPSFVFDSRANSPYYEEYEAGFSTRLFLRGSYYTPQEGERDILITLYPGDDVLNNFNVKRNSLYNITVNITDINPVQDGGDDYRIYLSSEPLLEKSTPPVFDDVWQGDDNVTGTGIAGAFVEVTFPDDSKVGAQVGPDSKWSVQSPVYLWEDDVLTATQTEDGKEVSEPVETVVLWVPPQEKSTPPAFNDVYEGDDEVTGTGIAGSTIEVTFPDNSRGTAQVDDNGKWSLESPVYLYEGEKLSATQTEPGKSVSDRAYTYVLWQRPVLEKSAPPAFNDVWEGDDKVTGTGIAGATVEVTFPGDAKRSAQVGSDGKWSIESPVALFEYDVLFATQTEMGKAVSEPAQTTVLRKEEMEQSEPPQIGYISNRSMQVTGYGIIGAQVTVILPNGSMPTVDVDLWGMWMVVSPAILTTGQTVYAFQTEPGKSPSVTVMRFVGTAD